MNSDINSSSDLVYLHNSKLPIPSRIKHLQKDRILHIENQNGSNAEVFVNLSKNQGSFKLVYIRAESFRVGGDQSLAKCLVLGESEEFML